VPIICMDARHANAALKVRPVKTDRNDAAGLAQIVRTGWFKQVRIKSRSNYQIRSLLTARDMLVRIRVKIENELRGLLRTFGVVFGRRVGGFTERASEIIAGELDASPEMRLVAETLMKARTSILDQIKVLDRRLSAVARATPVVRLFMTAPGVGVITALSVASIFDDTSRFRLIERGRLSRPDTPALRVRRNQPQRAHLQAGQPADQKAPLRGGHHPADAQPALLHAEGVGHEAGQSVRLQEGTRGRCPQAGRHPSCHVEDKHHVPLEPVRCMITKEHN